MLYISGQEMLVIVVVLVCITLGPPLAAWATALIRRRKERTGRKSG